jgi:hypothetical protein
LQQWLTDNAPVLVHADIISVALATEKLFADAQKQGIDGAEIVEDSGSVYEAILTRSFTTTTKAWPADRTGAISAGWLTYSVLNAVLLMAAERIHVRAEGGERLLYLARAFTLHLCLLFGRHGKEDALKFLQRLHGFHAAVGEERLHGVRLLQCGQRLTTKSGKGKCCAETDSFDVH